MTPLESFTSNEPITEARANNAADWLVHHALEIGRAKARKEKTDHLIKIAEAKAFLKEGGSNDVRRSAARASEEYLEAVEEHEQASAEYEILYATRVAAEGLISMFQTTSANQRRA